MDHLDNEHRHWLHNTLNEEFRQLIDQAAISREQVRRLLLNAVAASWQTEEEKRTMEAKFRHDPCWKPTRGDSHRQA